VVDPFGKYNSFGEHNNAKLCEFLDPFGFTYEFKSSTKIYQAGHFNDALLQVLKHYDEILEVMLPSLGDERRETYSPFLPIDKKSGKVLQAKVVKTSLDNKSITYIDEEGNEVETSVLDGNVKLQWKVDWAMRWYALDVDYEMSGKDLIPSVVLSSKICKILGKNPPLNLTYELFLDKNGEKISKSKGNGLSIEEWLRYGNKESLTYFMYQKPQTAKRLYFDIIPKSVDDWLLSLAKFKDLSVEEKLESPIFFIYNNNPIEIDSDITFSLIVNLVSVVKSDDKNLLWSFIKKYKNIEGKSIEIIDDLLTYAINYYNDFIQPTLEYKTLNDLEKNYLQTLLNKLEVLSKNSNASEVQNVVYSCGKELNLELKDWFALLYESLLGQKQGPRMGTFFVLYGLDNSIKLIKHTLQK
jgi:lysyl-tRNA synthetase class 1